MTIPQAPPPPRLRTVGVLAELLDVPIHRIDYILRTRPHICPAARAGRLRLYDSNAVESIRRALCEIEAKGGGR